MAEFDNDFREIFSTFQNMMDDLRRSPAEVISPESVDVAEKIAKLTVERTESQKQFARSLGEGVLLARLGAQIQEKEVLLAKDKKGLTKEELQRRKESVDFLAESIEANQSIAEKMNEQIQQYGEITGQARELSEFEKEIVDRKAQLVRLYSVEARTLNPELVKQKKEELELEIKHYEQLELERKNLEHQRALHNQLSTIFGVNIEGIKSQFREIQNLSGTLLGRLTLIAAAVAAVFKRAFDDFQEIRKTAGTSIQQTAHLGVTAIKGIGVAAHDSIILNDKAAAELAGNLAASFGNLDKVTAQSIANAARLNVVMGLSAEEASHFVADLEKIPGITPQVSHDFIETADQVARINHIAPQKLFQQMAQNTELMARAGARGADQIARAAAFATKAGVELSKFDDFADRSLDVTDMIQSFTKLGTLGIDLGDPFKFAQMAEANDIAGLQAQLQRALGGTDLTQLGRVRQRTLEQATGFTIQQLERIQQGKPIEAATEAAPQELETVRAQEKFDNMATSIGELIKSINFAQAALTALGVATAFGPLAKIFSGALRLAGFGGSAVGAGAEVAGVGGGLAGGAGAAGGAGVLATTGTAVGGLAGGLAIGTGITELLGWDSLYDFKRIHDANVRGDAATQEYNRIRARTEAMHQALAAGKTPQQAREAAEAIAQVPEGQEMVTDKLDELITMFRTGGINVVMDGKRVGRMIAFSQPRDALTR